jgi:hypothetical protein
MAQRIHSKITTSTLLELRQRVHAVMFCHCNHNHHEMHGVYGAMTHCCTVATGRGDNNSRQGDFRKRYYCSGNLCRMLNSYMYEFWSIEACQLAYRVVDNGSVDNGFLLFFIHSRVLVSLHELHMELHQLACTILEVVLVLVMCPDQWWVATWKVQSVAQMSPIHVVRMIMRTFAYAYHP